MSDDDEVEQSGDFEALPLEVVNALLMPVYEALSEDDALDGKADDIVRCQLRCVAEAGYVLTPTPDSGRG